MTPYRWRRVLPPTNLLLSLLLLLSSRGVGAFCIQQETHHFHPCSLQLSAVPNDDHFAAASSSSSSSSSSSTSINGDDTASSSSSSSYHHHDHPPQMSLRERLKERIRQTAAAGGITATSPATTMMQRPRASDGVYEITSAEQYSYVLCSQYTYYYDRRF